MAWTIAMALQSLGPRISAFQSTQETQGPARLQSNAGRAHAAESRCRWEPLAAHLVHLADLERKVETALAEEAA